MTPDSTRLLPQNTPTNLAAFHARLGILIIGRKKIFPRHTTPKGSPPGEPFLLRKERLMPASHLHRTNAAPRVPLADCLSLTADRSSAAGSTEIDAITAAYASNSAVSPANTAEIASHTSASHLTRPQSSALNTAAHAAITATFAASTTASQLIRSVPLADDNQRNRPRNSLKFNHPALRGGWGAGPMGKRSAAYDFRGLVPPNH